MEDNDTDEYVIKAKVCKILSRQLKLPEIHYDYMGEYTPPKEPGLSNSDAIIPQYYCTKKNLTKLLDVDYFNIIKDDIRNYRVLNKHKLQYIKNLPNDCKDELFDIYK